MSRSAPKSRHSLDTWFPSLRRRAAGVQAGGRPCDPDLGRHAAGRSVRPVPAVISALTSVEQDRHTASCDLQTNNAPQRLTLAAVLDSNTDPGRAAPPRGFQWHYTSKYQPSTHFVAPAVSTAAVSIAAAVSATETSATSEAAAPVTAVTASASTICKQNVGASGEAEHNFLLLIPEPCCGETHRLQSPRLLVWAHRTCCTLVVVQSSCCHKSCRTNFLKKSAAWLFVASLFRCDRTEG